MSALSPSAVTITLECIACLNDSNHRSLGDFSLGMSFEKSKGADFTFTFIALDIFTGYSVTFDSVNNSESTKDLVYNLNTNLKRNFRLTLAQQSLGRRGTDNECSLYVVGEFCIIRSDD